MNNRFWMIGLLLILAVICAFALAFINTITAPVIAYQNEVRYKSTVLDVFGITYRAGDGDAVIDAFAQSVDEHEINGMPAFTDKSSGRTALSLSGSGFQGEMNVIVSLDGDTITGFKVVSQVETPGLGARITEPAFQKSFTGKMVRNGITMVRSGSAGQSEFDAITGATETSRALQRILNRGFERYFAAVK